MLAEQTIYREYRCTNPNCEAKISFTQKAKDKWKKVCPFCRKHSLLMEHANMALSGLIDTKKAKTFGAVSDENRLRKQKETGIDTMAPKAPPFWRKKNKIDYSILKNPKKYIETGSL